MWLGKLSNVASVICLLVCAASCATTRGDLESGANQLERAADKLALDTRDVASGTEYQATHVRDAQVLAEDAHEFRRAADNGATRKEDLTSAFERVSRSYRLVRDDVAHSDNLHVRSDFAATTDAYLHTERDVRGYAALQARAF